MTVTEYIKQIQSYEEFSFSWDEILENCKAPVPTIRKELIRLTEKNEVLNLRHGFYIIIPPRYQNLMKLPIHLYVEKLFTVLNKEYYVGLFSAASVYGASHQKIQQDYILTVPPALRDIDKGKNKLRFIKTENWPEGNIIEKKSEAGNYKISSPALTAVDLVQHHSKIGGLNRILANIEELSQEITKDDLMQLLSWYPHKSSLQRFGFLIDYLEINNFISDEIFNKLKEDAFYSILLSPKKGIKAGKTGNRWKVDVNIKLENDL